MIYLLTIAFSFVSSVSFAQDFVKFTLDRPSYNAGQTAHLRYWLNQTPENPAYEFVLVAKLNNQAIALSKLSDTEFYSKLESLSAGNKTISAEIFIQDRRLAQALSEAVRWHDSEINRLNGEIANADPVDVPALEAERAEHEARKADALARLSSIRRHFSGPTTFKFSVLN